MKLNIETNHFVFIKYTYNVVPIWFSINSLKIEIVLIMNIYRILYTSYCFVIFHLVLLPKTAVIFFAFQFQIDLHTCEAVTICQRRCHQLTIASKFIALFVTTTSQQLEYSLK